MMNEGYLIGTLLVSFDGEKVTFNDQSNKTSIILSAKGIPGLLDYLSIVQAKIRRIEREADAKSRA